MKALVLLLAGALGAVWVALGLVAVLLAGGGAAGCLGGAGTDGASGGEAASGGRAWLATAYGPPWGGIQGDGVTATGLDLRSDPALLEVAVDPRVVALGSYVHVQPNPFGTDRAFYAGDTGGAILGRHIDVYDWRGRARQLAWGERQVSVTPAAMPGAGNLLGAVAPAGPAEEGSGGGCPAAALDGSIGLSAADTARILPDGSAVAPNDAPLAVRRAIAAGNLIHTLPYPEPDVHFGSLAQLWPAYDCSGASSFVLYGAGLLGPGALDSTGLESYGLPGPGRWITVYANSAHAWIVVAGVALDTADYGGPPVPEGSGPRWRAGALANLEDGSAYVARHPEGL